MIVVDRKKLFYYIIFLFVIGAFFGLVFESLLISIKEKKFITKPGLWHTGLKPIYGIGILLSTLIFNKYQDKNILITFIGSIIICTIFEYFASVFQEYVLHTSTWNYDGKRIDVIASITWGIFSSVWIKYGLNIFTNIFNKIYTRPFKVITILLFLFLIFDITKTSAIVNRYSKRKRGIEATTKMDKHIDKTYKNSKIEEKFPNLRVKT